jgi:hypothetical protein
MQSKSSTDTVINVNLEKSVASCGEDVSGIVTFKPGHFNDKLYIEVYGRETVAWVETVSYSVQGWNQTYVEEFKDERRLFHSTLLVDLPAELNLSRTYQIPFSFQLPLTLPGYCVETSGFGTTFRVRAYNSMEHIKAVAEVHVIQPNIITKSLTVKSKQPLKLCCTQRGSVSSRFTLDKPSYAPGETIHVTPVILNDSKGNLKLIEMKLRSVTEMHAPGKMKKIEKLVCQTTHLWNPNDLQQCSFGQIYSHYYVLDIHLNMSAGWGPSCSVPVIVLGCPVEERLITPNDPESQELLPLLIRITPVSHYEPCFSIKSFPNVSELSADTSGSRIWKSASRLMRSFSTFTRSTKGFN